VSFYSLASLERKDQKVLRLYYFQESKISSYYQLLVHEDGVKWVVLI
jgi:hypothetical protein